MWIRRYFDLIASQLDNSPNDNTEHHPQIATYPHHKHEGSEENVIPSFAPTLAAVLAEIERMIQSS